MNIVWLWWCLLLIIKYLNIIQ